MRRNGQMLLLFVCTTFLAIPTRAQSTRPPTLTEEQILDKYVEALGGRPTLEGVKSVIKKGLIIRKGGSALVNAGGRIVTESTDEGQEGIESYWKAGKSLLIAHSPANGEVRSGITGGVFWGLFKGRVTMGKAPLLVRAGASYFESELNWRQDYTKLKLKGIKKVGGRLAYKLEISTRAGAQITNYYDTETFLLLRTESLGERWPVDGSPSDVARVRADTFFSDYRDVGGVKFPFETKEAVTDIVTRYSEIQVNGQLDDSIFQPPPGSNR